LNHLRRLGYLAEFVEKFIPTGQRKRDLFGIGEVIGFHVRDRQVLLVQCTSLAHVTDRLTRIKARWELPLFLKAGVAMELGMGKARQPLGRKARRRSGRRPRGRGVRGFAETEEKRGRQGMLFA